VELRNFAHTYVCSDSATYLPHANSCFACVCVWGGAGGCVWGGEGEVKIYHVLQCLTISDIPLLLVHECVDMYTNAWICTCVHTFKYLIFM